MSDVTFHPFFPIPDTARLQARTADFSALQKRIIYDLSSSGDTT